MRFSSFLFFMIILNNLSINSQTSNTVLSKIVLEKKDNFITLRAKVENESPIFKDELTYNFIALKKDEKGSFSNNKQEGKFSLKPNEEKEIAKISLNLIGKEELRSYLFIKYKDKLVSKDTIWLSSNNKKQIITENKEEKDFFLKGIVLDEAFTIIGKNFHDYFYQQYLLSNRKYPFVIKIKEKPGLARSSIIYVEVEDFKIHEFFSKPNEDYLKNNVKIVLQKTSVYAKRRSALRKANKF